MFHSLGFRFINHIYAEEEVKFTNTEDRKSRLFPPLMWPITCTIQLRNKQICRIYPDIYSVTRCSRNRAYRATDLMAESQEKGAKKPFHKYRRWSSRSGENMEKQWHCKNNWTPPTTDEKTRRKLVREAASRPAAALKELQEVLVVFYM